MDQLVVRDALSGIFWVYSSFGLIRQDFKSEEFELVNCSKNALLGFGAEHKTLLISFFEN